MLDAVLITPSETLFVTVKRHGFHVLPLAIIQNGDAGHHVHDNETELIYGL